MAGRRACKQGEPSFCGARGVGDARVADSGLWARSSRLSAPLLPRRWQGGAGGADERCRRQAGEARAGWKTSSLRVLFLLVFRCRAFRPRCHIHTPKPTQAALYPWACVRATLASRALRETHAASGLPKARSGWRIRRQRVLAPWPAPHALPVPPLTARHVVSMQTYVYAKATPLPQLSAQPTAPALCCQASR